MRKELGENFLDNLHYLITGHVLIARMLPSIRLHTEGSLTTFSSGHSATELLYSCRKADDDCVNSRCGLSNSIRVPLSITATLSKSVMVSNL